MKERLCTLETKLPLNLFPPLLPLQLLPELLHLLPNAFLALFPLPLLIQGPAFHNPCYNLGSIDILEFVVSDLAINVQSLGDSVGIVCERHEGGYAVVDEGKGGSSGCSGRDSGVLGGIVGEG